MGRGVAASSEYVVTPLPVPPPQGGRERCGAGVRPFARAPAVRSAQQIMRGRGMRMTRSLTLRAMLVSVAIFALFVTVWQLATMGSGPAVPMDPEYAKLVGATASQGKSAMPGPLDVWLKIWEHLKNPFYDRGTNDKGLGIQLAWSIARVMAGYLLAVAVAIPTGFLVGMSPLMSRALDPFIQVLKPISPLAWMPLALYTIKDSHLSSIFVIFICSLW